MTVTARAYALVLLDTRDGEEKLALETLREHRADVDRLAEPYAEISREFGRPWERPAGIALVEVRELQRLPLPATTKPP